LPAKKGVSVIKCECGFEIPVVADVKMLGRAIDEHVEEHKRNCLDPENAEIAANRIQDNLFKQLFEKIAQMSM
jgi:hypothetical protein